MVSGISGWLQHLQVHSGLLGHHAGGGLVLLITAGEAHLGVPVPHQPCPVGLHGAVVVGPAHVSQLLGPLVARLVGGVLGQVLLAVLLEKGSSG